MRAQKHQPTKPFEFTRPPGGTSRTASHRLNFTESESHSANETIEDADTAIATHEQGGCTEVDVMNVTAFWGNSARIPNTDDTEAQWGDNPLTTTSIPPESFSSSSPRNTAPDAVTVVEEEESYEPPVAPAAHRPVTAAQIAKLVAVVATAPLRIAVGVALIPIALLIQVGLWAKRAVSTNPVATAATWKSPTEAVPRKTYQRRMILQRPYSDFLDPIRPSTSVRKTAHTIDKVVTMPEVPNYQQPVDKQNFSSLTLNDRLDLEAHGSGYFAAEMYPQEFARYLRDQGLQSVGVLNLGSCEAASADYLEQLGNALDEMGIEFGWLAGAREITTDFRFATRLGNSKYTWSFYALPWKKSAALIAPQALNRKVLRGNAGVDFQGTVFDSKRPWWRIASSYSPWR